MGLSRLIVYAILHFIFRNNRVSRAEAKRSNPVRLFGMNVWPRRNEGDVKIPKCALIGLGVWVVISLLIELRHW